MTKREKLMLGIAAGLGVFAVAPWALNCPDPIEPVRFVGAAMTSVVGGVCTCLGPTTRNCEPITVMGGLMCVLALGIATAASTPWVLIGAVCGTLSGHFLTAGFPTA